ncbi:hypothetical protein RJT34_02964 [Clitoria ternatea]|uniref:Uncharacterized protein n=1 Tax=Clitoria ternatea TaxID=43366 RepID=A0AAN9KI16_CLITE
MWKKLDVDRKPRFKQPLTKDRKYQILVSRNSRRDDDIISIAISTIPITDYSLQLQSLLQKLFGYTNHSKEPQPHKRKDEILFQKPPFLTLIQNKK